MFISGNTLSLVGRTLGTSVQGARTGLGADHSGAAGVLGTVLGNADVMLNGRDAVSSAGLGARMVQRLAADSPTALAHLTQGSIAISLPAQARIDVIAQREQELARQLAAARAQAANGDVSANAKVDELQRQSGALSTLRLTEQVNGAKTYEQSVVTRFSQHYGERASGWESLLDLGTQVNVMDRLRGATTPQDRAQLSAQLETASHVAEARLGTLRAEIEYLQHLVDTGQLTADQQQRLEALSNQYAGMQQRLQVVENARSAFQRDNAQLLAKKVNEYGVLDGRADELAAAQVRLTGKTRDGRSVDFDKLNARQQRQVLDAERTAIRANNTSIVEHGDFTRVDAHEAQQQKHWDEWARQDRLAAERRRDEEDRRRRDQEEQRRVDERRDDPLYSTDALYAQNVQIVTQRYRAWQQAEHERFMQAHQSHA